MRCELCYCICKLRIVSKVWITRYKLEIARRKIGTAIYNLKAVKNLSCPELGNYWNL